MDKLQKAYVESVDKVDNFGQENAAAIAVNPIAAAQFAIISAHRPLLVEAGTERTAASGEKFNQSWFRKTNRENLYDTLLEISEDTRTYALINPAFAGKFPMPRTNRNDQTYIETGRAFIKEATPLKDYFISYGCEEDFLEDLQEKIDALAASISGQDTAKRSRLDADADFDHALGECLKAIRILKAIVPKIFKNNPGKLADWRAACHVEKPARENKPTPPQNPQ